MNERIEEARELVDYQAREARRALSAAMVNLGRQTAEGEGRVRENQPADFKPIREAYRHVEECLDDSLRADGKRLGFLAYERRLEEGELDGLVKSLLDAEGRPLPDLEGAGPRSLETLVDRLDRALYLAEKLDVLEPENREALRKVKAEAEDVRSGMDLAEQ